MHITFGANEFKFAFYWCEWRSIAHLLWCKGFQMCVFLVQMEIKFALASWCFGKSNAIIFGAFREIK